MIRRAAYTVLLLALAFAVTTAAVAAGGQIMPQMDTGHTDRPPQTPTVSEKPDQIRASAAIGGKVVDAKGNELATITDLIASRKQRSVEFAILDFGGDNGRTATAWGHLLFEAAPAPHFVAVLSREALVADRAPDRQGNNADDSFHITTDLMGKKAVGADGANLGEIEDVVVTLVSGRLVALVIDTGGLFNVGTRHRAVAWDAADPDMAKGKGPVRLAISKADLQAAPTIATKAPAPVPIESGNTTPIFRRDSAGNLSGSRIPAPADRRK